MGKASKATKRFQKHHLKKTIETRKRYQNLPSVKRRKQAEKAQAVRARSGGKRPRKDDGEEEDDDSREDGRDSAEDASDDDGADDASDASEDGVSDGEDGDGWAQGAAMGEYGEEGFLKSLNRGRGAGEDADEDDDEDDDENDEALFAKLNAMVDGDDDDDDDDEDAGADDAPEADEDDDEPAGRDRTKGKAAKGLTPEQHRAQLAKLKEQDPEFYEFLQKNDRALLEFDDEEEEADTADDDVTAAATKDKLHDPDAVVLTKAMIDGWVKDIDSGTLFQGKRGARPARHLLAAFRAGCHYGDADEDVAKEMWKYKVASVGVFNHLMKVGLTALLEHFNKVLNYKPPATGVKKLPRSSAKWDKVAPLSKLLLNAVLHLLQNSSDARLLAFILNALEPGLPYAACFPRISKTLLKVLLNLWGSAEDSLRVVAFLNIRRLALTCPYPFIDMCLKGIYLSFVRNAKFTSARTVPLMAFLSNCVVEIYGLDMASAYQHAFVYIRQLAITLRNALHKRTKEAYQTVYNWQFVHSIRVWAKVLGTYCARTRPGGAPDSTSPLVPLIYPLIQVALGTARLLPTAYFIPLRVQCIKAVIDLCEQTGFYAPVAPPLLELLSSSVVTGKPKPGTQKRMDLTTVLRVPAGYLRSHAYKEGVVELLVDGLVDFFAVHATDIAFPDLAFPVVVQLRRFVKSSKDVRTNRAISQLIEKLEQNAKFIDRERSSVDFAPKDLDKVTAFAVDAARRKASPLLTYRQSMLAVRRQRLQQLQAAAHADDEKRKRKGRKPSDSEEEEDGDESEDEDDDEEDDEEGSDGDDKDEDESAEEDEVHAAKPAKPTKPAKPAKSTKKRPQDADDEEDDDFFAGMETVYDDEDDDVVAPAPTKHPKAKGSKPQPKKQGGASAGPQAKKQRL